MKKCLLIFIILFTLLNNLLGQKRENQTLSPQEVQQIQNTVEEIIGLTTPSEMPRRIELLNFVLSKISKGTNPKYWASLEALLANSLFQNPLGNRAENLEHALKHYRMALQVFSKETSPKMWAETQNNLANTYLDRIRGDRTENLELAIKHYKLVLQVWNREAFPEYWAMIQKNLGDAYSDRIRGDRAENIERAIEYYRLALHVRDRNEFPKDWAAAQTNIGNSYLDRILGARAKNIERAIEHYSLALQVYTKEAFPNDWAMIQNNLSIAYRNRIHGNRAVNIEKAIENAWLALQVRIKEAVPEDWAATQNNLGNAYYDRVRGTRAENIERAIEYYSLALQVYTKEAFPENCAAIHNNMGVAYSKRILGDRAENLEHAIEYYRLALQVRNEDESPNDWAATQNNLGNVYYDRIRGDRAENIEHAIKHCKLALQVYIREAFPKEWALTQHHLANIYSIRIRGDRAENLECAIEHCRLALQVYTRDAFPKQWAMTQHSLGAAYWDRIRGERAENLERAIEHLELAMEVYDRESFPEEWASTHSNLAVVHSDRINGDRVKNLEQSIYHCNQSLRVYTREAFPNEWALIQHHLAIAYQKRIQEDRAENLEKAIEHYKLALQVYTQKGFPEDWAMIQNNLALAYSNRFHGDRTENHERAIKHYSLALQVTTKETFPHDFVKTSINLGNILLKTQAWINACETYSAAESVGEDLVTLAAGEEEQAKSLALFQLAFSGHAFALARSNQSQLALDVLEKGKARSLNQALLLQRIGTSGLNPETQKTFNSLQREIINLQQQLKGISDQEVGRYTLLVPELRCRQAELRKLFPIILQQLQLETMEDWNIERALEKCRKEQTALVAINVTPVGTLLLISSPNKEDLIPIFLDSFNSDSLDQISWRDVENQSLPLCWIKLFPQKEEHWARWCEQQPRILAKLGNWLWPKLDQFLQAEKIQRIILIPQGKLFLYPLHATLFTPLNTHENKDIYPIERYTIVITPSLRLYDQLGEVAKADVRDKQVLFVEDPDGNLGFSFAGQKNLSNQIKDKKMVPILLHESEITAENVLQYMRKAVLIHYYGHGHYNWNNPEASGLKLYSTGRDIKLLTMEKIVQTLAGNQASLVVLSACETGMTDVMHSHWRDQYVGLPSGFLRSGSNTVVGSLWPVPNRETCLLFCQFYQELLSRKKAVCPAEALRQAQLWMLHATPKEITEAEDIYLGIKPGVSELKLGKTREYYSHPAYWAAFYVVGNGFLRFE